MPQTTCSQCNAQYKSERELLDHMGFAHRRFSLEQGGSEPDESQAAIFAAQGDEEQDT